MPRALEAGIRAAGHECDGARRLIGADASDVEIAEVANQLGAAVLSKDVDFVDLEPELGPKPLEVGAGEVAEMAVAGDVERQPHYG